MTNLNIDEKVAEIRELEAKMDEFKDKIEALKDLLKAEFDKRGVDTIHTELYNLSYLAIYKNTLDGVKLKKDNPELYAQYAKETSYLRFAITNRG